MKAVAIAFIWVTLLAGLASPYLAQAAPLLGQQQEQGELEKLKAQLEEQRKLNEELTKKLLGAPQLAAQKSSLKDAKVASTWGLERSGIPPESLSAMMSLYKLRNIERCVVKFKHWVLLEGEGLFGSDKILKPREGHILLLGSANNSVVGYTTLCGIDFAEGIQFDDARIDPQNPRFVAGLFALEVPDDKRLDFYLVEHETNRKHEYLQKPEKLKPFLDAIGVSAEFWTDLLQSGDRVTRQKFGRNDLALVTFDRKKWFGDTASSVGAFERSLKLEKVAPNSPAARARISSGDHVVAINKKRLTFHQEVVAKILFGQKDVTVFNVLDEREVKAQWEKFLEECPFNEAVPVEIVRPERNLIRYVVFEHPGNFITEGKVATLGLSKPAAIFTTLFEEQEKLSLIRKQQFLKCEWCLTRVDTAPLKAPMTMLEKGAFISTIAGHAAFLLNQEAASEGFHKVSRTLKGAQAALDLAVEIERGFKAAGDLGQYFEKTFVLGAPIEIDPGAAKVTYGDRFEVTDETKVKRKFRLAYIIGAGQHAEDYLQSLFDLAYDSGLKVVAIPDGKDFLSYTHVHLFMLRPGDQPVFDPATMLSRMAYYVNPMMILEGGCHVFDHRVSEVTEGNPTRFIYSGFKALEALKKAFDKHK